MLFLQSHHITDLYCLIDDTVPKVLKPKGGRPPVLSDSELTTILIWNALTVRQKTLKAVYQWVKLYHGADFPKLPSYSAFVDHCHRLTPLLIQLLAQLLNQEALVRLMDSTMIEVCKRARADSHKVAKSVAKFGKNHQGWHYGFKLHASIDRNGKFCGLALTPANVHDAQMMPAILNGQTKVAVGDGAYTARVMSELIWKNYGTIVISPPHPKQTKKIMTRWQYLLLKLRPKIESVFDYLKEHLHLVTSFPRSVKGYLLHYVRILLGYQMLVI